MTHAENRAENRVVLKTESARELPIPQIMTGDRPPIFGNSFVFISFFQVDP